MKKLFLFAVAFMFIQCSTQAEPSETSTPQEESPAIQEPPTAKEWNKDVVGWNLGNQFECVAWPWENESVEIGLGENHMDAETAWKCPTVTKKVIQAVKAAGFNAIRIPIRWQCHIVNPSAMTISPEWMARIKEVVGWCLDEDLKVIINVHHEKWLESRPFTKYQKENNQKLALLWMNIATAFASYDYRLAFAGTNEVHVPDNWGAPTAENLEVQNSYNQTFVSVVRSTGGNNAKRHLLCQTYVCNPQFGIDGGFFVPEDIEGNGNNYMSVEFHYYTPYDYCGECKYYYWGEYGKNLGGECSPQTETDITNFYNRVMNVWSRKGLGVCIGEWGVTNHFQAGKADEQHANAKYYCKFFVEEALKRGFSCFVWDSNTFNNGIENFGIFNRGAGMKVEQPWLLEGIMEGKNQ